MRATTVDTTDGRRHLDVVFVTDPRLQGGGNKSIAEEAQVLAAAGYRIGVLPLASPMPEVARPADRSLATLFEDGRVTLLRPDEPLRCRLLVGRGPAVFGEPQTVRPDVLADRAVLVLNAVHVDQDSSDLAYDPATLEAAATELFGLPWEFHPLSEVVRARLAATVPDLTLASVPWGNIIDVDRWWRPRSREVARPLRLGRHSRDNPLKWPDTAEQILEVYPDRPDVEVHALGGAHALRELLPTTPANWRLYRFDAQEVLPFLHQLDFYAYYHSSRWIEAFGRAPLEALAAGAVVVLPPYLQPVFGDAARYAERGDALAVVEELADDPAARADQLERSRQLTAERHGTTAYVDRMRGLLGGPPAHAVTGHRVDVADAASVVPEVPPRVEVGATERRPVVLFFTDNGIGLGHVTRLLAMARRLGDDVQPVFLTMSESHSVVRDAGFPVEYFPSARKLQLDRSRWAPLLDRRLRAMVSRLRPEVLVVDHVAPSTAFRGVRGAFPHLCMVWSRRGLWQAGRNPRALQMADAFDLIIEPSDVAASLDRGATVGASGEIRTVRPITLVSREELLSREEARAELGLSGTAVLVQLADDDAGRLHELIATVRDQLADLGIDQVFAPLHVLHRGNLTPVPGVSMRPIYPMSRYLRAFDAAVSAAGYNSFHELVMAGVPSVFVAKDHRGLDDQQLRARFAELGGFGWCTPSVDDPGFATALAAAIDEGAAARARAAAAALYPGNGAVDAAAIILDLVRRGRIDTDRAPEARPGEAPPGAAARTEAARHEAAPHGVTT